MATQLNSSPNSSDPMYQDLAKPRLTDAEHKALDAAYSAESVDRSIANSVPADKTRIRLTDAERKLLDAAHTSPKYTAIDISPPTKTPATEPGGGDLLRTQAIPAEKCTHCGEISTLGDRLCATCRRLISYSGNTSRLNIPDEMPVQTNRAFGNVFVGMHRPIIFEIGGKQFTLPVEENLVIGRVSYLPGDAQPDVSLNPYEAEEKGVSRQHIRITRKHDLIYVADAGSTNGSFLNGMRLNCNSERVLRNGDELRLGHLKIRVSF
jgi:hypothetical protein